MRKINTLLYWCAFVVLCMNLSHAETRVGGVIAQNTTWLAQDGPFIVNEDVVIPANVTLTIDAGALIYMGSNFRLVVDGGSVQANGTQLKPIKVTALSSKSGAASVKGEWNQWIFKNSKRPSRLNYTEIEYGKGLSILASTVELNYVKLRAHQGAAIQMDVHSSLLGTGNSAFENDQNAVLVAAGDVVSSAVWGLKGIPFLVPSGVLSVGASPKIGSVIGPTLERGRSAVFELNGSRLTGLSQILPEAKFAALNTKMIAVNGDIGGRFEVAAPLDIPLGPVAITALTDAGEAKFANAVTIIPRQVKFMGVQPNRVVVGQGPVSLALTGDTFSADSRVLFAGKQIAAQWLDAEHLRVELPNQTQPGVYPIQIRSPDIEDSSKLVLSEALQIAVDAQALLFLDSNLLIEKGKNKISKLRLAYPAQESTTIKLSSSKPSVVSVPPLITFPIGSIEQAVELSALSSGTAIINASQDGYTTASLNAVVDTPLALTAEPTSLILPLGGSERTFNLTLSHVETSDQVFGLSVANSAVASLSAGSVTIPAGQVSMPVKLKGLAEGRTEITVTSPLLGSLSIPVYISSEHEALSMTYASPLGIYIPGGEYIGRSDITNTTLSPNLGVFVDAPNAREADPRYLIFAPSLGIRVGNPDEGASPLGEIVAPPLGVAVGKVITGMNRTALNRGQSVELIISGAELAGVNQVSVEPAQGVVLTSFVPAVDGKSVRVFLNIGTDAVLGGRRFVLTTSTGVVPARNGADWLPLIP